MNLNTNEIKIRIAKKIAELLPDKAFVNLGVGIPTMVCDYLPSGKELIIQTENGMLGVGPAPAPEFVDSNLINASRKPVTETPGCVYFDSAASFAMIRSGRMDVTVIGAIQVAENGDLANWALPGTGVLGPGGALDLVTGVKNVIVATQHTTPKGAPKLVKECTVPLTGLGVVGTVVTEYAVFTFENGRMVLQEYASDTSLEEIANITAATYSVADNVRIWQV